MIRKKTKPCLVPATISGMAAAGKESRTGAGKRRDRHRCRGTGARSSSLRADQGGISRTCITRWAPTTRRQDRLSRGRLAGSLHRSSISSSARSRSSAVAARRRSSSPGTSSTRTGLTLFLIPLSLSRIFPLIFVRIYNYFL